MFDILWASHKLITPFCFANRFIAAFRGKKKKCEHYAVNLEQLETTKGNSLGGKDKL